MRTLLAFLIVALFATCAHAVVFTNAPRGVFATPLNDVEAGADAVNCDGALKLSMQFEITTGTFTGNLQSDIGGGFFDVVSAPTSATADDAILDVTYPNGNYRPELTVCGSSCVITVRWKCVYAR